MYPEMTDSDFININNASLEELVHKKLSLLFDQQKQARVEIDGLHKLIMEQVERPLIQLTLKTCQYNFLKTSQVLGINRNTLRKKMEYYSIETGQRHNKVTLT